MRPFVRRRWPLLTLFVLALAAFWPLVLRPNQTLYSHSSDLLAQHIPAKTFLVRSLRETGELPLWNPEQFAGSPFVHDIQVGLFYPPHLPMYVLGEAALGPFLSWLVLVHVLLAGWLMYAYARHAGLGPLAAFTAGAGYMLAPRWLMQMFLAGHTITQGLAWLPLVLLCVERAMLRRDGRWALGSGLAYALLVLGTGPQWTLYASLLIGLWPLRLMIEGAASYRRWLLTGMIVGVVGISLGAVQLLPTLEAAGETSRARGMGQSWSLLGAQAAAMGLIGPFPDQEATALHWETRGGIGFTWAVLTLFGAVTGGRSGRFVALVGAGMLLYALGASVLIDRLPGFRSFRMPTRMLLPLAFPTAFLAGQAVQSLMNEWPRAALGRATGIAAAVSLPGLVAALAVPGEATAMFWLYWLVVPSAWIVLLILAPRCASGPRTRLLVALLAADVLIVVLPYPDTRSVPEIFPPSPILDYIRANNPEGQRVYDPEWYGKHLEETENYSSNYDSLLGPGSPAASMFGVPSVRGYNPLDVTRYRQFLAFIADDGEPLAAFSNEFTFPVVAAFPVRNRSLFDLLGVRFVVRQTDDPYRHIPLTPEPWDGLGDAVLRDPQPRCYNLLVGGVRAFPPVNLYQNQAVMPRAFVLADAVPQAPEGQVLAQLKSIDVRRTATLEHWDPAADPLPRSDSEPGPAVIRSHQPNEIVIDLDGRTAGLLVLTDPWYPGWVCRIDGSETKLWKADYAFRGVFVPEGAREVVFRFEPRSYRQGKCVSLVTLAGVLGVLLLGGLRRIRTPRSGAVAR